jgi:hypothetical protein
LLNAASVRLLADVLLEPTSLDEIVECFAPNGDEKVLQQNYADILSLLERLERFGLVKKTVIRQNG